MSRRLPVAARIFRAQLVSPFVARYRDDQWSSARHRAECSARKAAHWGPTPLLAPIVELLLQLVIDRLAYLDLHHDARSGHHHVTFRDPIPIGVFDEGVAGHSVLGRV